MFVWDAPISVRVEHSPAPRKGQNFVVGGLVHRSPSLPFSLVEMYQTFYPK